MSKLTNNHRVAAQIEDARSAFGMGPGNVLIAKHVLHSGQAKSNYGGYHFKEKQVAVYFEHAGGTIIRPAKKYWPEYKAELLAAGYEVKEIAAS